MKGHEIMFAQMEIISINMYLLDFRIEMWPSFFMIFLEVLILPDDEF